MRALIANDPQLAVTVPYCMLAVCRGLQSKTVPFGNGTVSYTSVLSPAVEPDPERVIGFTPFGYSWNIHAVDPVAPKVNAQYPVLKTTVPAYNQEQGAQAFQQICQFLAEDDPTGPCRMVRVSSPTALDNDCSEFAYHRPSLETIGLSTNGPRTIGASGTMNLEVPIFRPLFSCFNSGVNEVAAVQRFGNLHANACGDGTFLAAAQCSWFREHMWKMQRPPKLHYVDFNEFGDVFAKWVSGMQQAFLNDPANALVNPDILTCTLTLQDALILLRNVIMTAFKETQIGVHSIYPEIPLDINSTVLVPFVCGLNTVFQAQTDMRLPTPIVENIRALVTRFIHRKGDDYEIFIPVLCARRGDVLDENDYSFGTAETTYPSFRSSSIFAHQREITKTGVIMRPLAETPINLIDGASVSGATCINDPAALKNNVDLWEAWLTKTGVAAYSTELSVLGTEKGISILASSMMDRFIGSQNIDQNKKIIAEFRRKNSTNNLCDIVVNHNKFFQQVSTKASQVYANRDVSLDMSQSKILATAYEQVLSIWVLPVAYFSFNTQNAITPIRWQAINDEPYSQIRTNGVAGQTLDALHACYASKMVRNKLQEKTDWENLFTELAATGRGGILSDLVGKFADTIIPGAGNIVRTVGGAIGV
jgi:hypothetical protein